MSLRRSAAIFLFSAIFVSSTFLTVNSYILGNALEKENMKNLLNTEIIPQIVREQCEAQCNQTTSYVYGCVEACVESQNITEKVDEEVEKLYVQPVFGTTVSDFTSVLSSSFLLLLITSIVSGIVLFLISKHPLKKVGWSILWVGVSLFVVGVMPRFLPLPTASVVQNLVNYMVNLFAQLMYIGIAFIVVGVVFFIADRSLKVKNII